MTKDDKVSEFKEKYHSLGVISIELSREQSTGARAGHGNFEAVELREVPEKGLK